MSMRITTSASPSRTEQKYSLPEDVNEEEINAKVEDGILTIELPKLQKVVGKTTKQIEIK